MKYSIPVKSYNESTFDLPDGDNVDWAKVGVIIASHVIENLGGADERDFWVGLLGGLKAECCDSGKHDGAVEFRIRDLD